LQGSGRMAWGHSGAPGWPRSVPRLWFTAESARRFVAGRASPHLAPAALLMSRCTACMLIGRPPTPPRRAGAHSRVADSGSESGWRPALCRRSSAPPTRARRGVAPPLQGTPQFQGCTRTCAAGSRGAPAANGARGQARRPAGSEAHSRPPPTPRARAQARVQAPTPCIGGCPSCGLTTEPPLSEPS